MGDLIGKETKEKERGRALEDTLKSIPCNSEFKQDLHLWAPLEPPTLLSLTPFSQPVEWGGQQVDSALGVRAKAMRIGEVIF